LCFFWFSCRWTDCLYALLGLSVDVALAKAYGCVVAFVLKNTPTVTGSIGCAPLQSNWLPRSHTSWQPKIIHMMHPKNFGVRLLCSCAAR